MIPEHVPTIDPLTSFGLQDDIILGYYRHRMLGVLAATSTGLRAIFHEPSPKTIVLAGANTPTLAGLLGGPETPQVFVHVECVLSLSPVPSNSIRLW